MNCRVYIAPINNNTMDSFSRISNFVFTLTEVFHFQAEQIDSTNPMYSEFTHLVVVTSNNPSLSSYDLHNVQRAALIDNCSAMYAGTEQVQRKHARVWKHMFEVRPRFLPMHNADNAMFESWCKTTDGVSLESHRADGLFELNKLTIGEHRFDLVMRAPFADCHRYQLRLADSFETLTTFDTALELVAWINHEFLNS